MHCLPNYLARRAVTCILRDGQDILAISLQDPRQDRHDRARQRAIYAVRSTVRLGQQFQVQSGRENDRALARFAHLQSTIG